MADPKSAEACHKVYITLCQLRRFYFTMLTWLPSYIVDELHCSDLTMASTLSLLPPLAGIACR